MDRFYVRHVRPLGHGGLATVDVVEVTSEGGPYRRGTELARKQLGARWSNDPGAQHRFEQEIRILSTMRHPGTIQVMGVSLPGLPRFYLMPLYPRSLRALMQRTAWPADVSWVIGIGLALARTLQYAHEHGFVHRDLKPENILLNNDNEPVVADWGLGQFIHKQSKVLDLGSDGAEAHPYYCPAEQWATGRCDAAGDIYSLGLILSELAIGFRLPISPPFSGIRRDILPNTTAQASFFNQTIRKMTHAFPHARHESMRDVEIALLSCM